jgi:transcription elongation factor GreA
MATEDARVPMTQRGYQLLLEELKRLKSVERPKIVREIEEARGHGDLSENAEFHAAKERQSLLDVQIREIEELLARAQVIEVSKLSGDKVVFGATVSLADAFKLALAVLDFVFLVVVFLAVD